MAAPMPSVGEEPTIPQKAVAVAITRLRKDSAFEDALAFVCEVCGVLGISAGHLIAALAIDTAME